MLLVHILLAGALLFLAYAHTVWRCHLCRFWCVANMAAAMNKKRKVRRGWLDAEHLKLLDSGFVLCD